MKMFESWVINVRVTHDHYIWCNINLPKRALCDISNISNHLRVSIWIRKNRQVLIDYSKYIFFESVVIEYVRTLRYTRVALMRIRAKSVGFSRRVIHFPKAKGNDFNRFRPRPHISGNLWKRKFFFTNTACVHTYSAYFPAVSGNFWKRSPEWKFFYPIRIRIRVDGRIRKVLNTLTSFSWIQSSRRAL